MDNPSIQPSAEPIAVVSEPFKKWPECFRQLKKLPISMPDSDAEAFVKRIRESRLGKVIAFQILLLILDGKYTSKISWLEGPMVDLLGDGADEPNFGNYAVPSEARTWVYREFREVRNMGEWKRFVSSGRHLWVLYGILSSATDKQLLLESLTTFSECAAQAQSVTADGTRKKTAVDPSDPKWIGKLVRARIPTKLDLSKAFLESLFAIHSISDLSEALRRESNGLHFQIRNLEEELLNERKAKAVADGQVQSLQEDLDTARNDLVQAKQDLEEERLHNKRQGGFNTVSRSETINEVLSAVRQGTLSRLDNIRGYADRENPNREEIVELVGEIEKHLSKIEEGLRK